MNETTKIFDDLIPNKNNIETDEQKLYKELLEFEKSQKKESLPIQNRCFDFFVAEPQTNYNIRPDIRLAADSSTIDSEVNFKESKFLITNDNRLALKYIQKSKDEIQITLLLDTNFDTNEMLLYLPDLKKYYISNISGDYIITGFPAVNIRDMKFQALQMFDKIIISNEENQLSILSYNNFSNPEIIEKSDTLIKIKLNSKTELKKAVLYNEGTKDFLDTDGKIIEIPILLLQKKSIVLLF